MNANVDRNEAFVLLSIMQRAVANYAPKTEESKKYIERGINLRYILLKDSIILLHESIHRLENDRYSIGNVNIAANSIYNNIKGVLDNIAWILRFDVIGEAMRTTSISLSNKKFLEKLKTSKFKIEIKPMYLDWLNDLAKKRDPIAHRLPIYIPPKTIINECDKVLAEKYIQKASDSIIEGNMDGWYAFMNKLNALGSFAPILIVDEAETKDFTTVNLNDILIYDFKMLSGICSEILSLINENA